MNKEDKEAYRCDSCGEEIAYEQEYYALTFSREVREKDGIRVLSSQELRNWCKKCYEELQIILKTNISEIR